MGLRKGDRALIWTVLRLELTGTIRKYRLNRHNDSYTEYLGSQMTVCSDADIPAAQKLNTFTIYHGAWRRVLYLQRNEDEV